MPRFRRIFLSLLTILIVVASVYGATNAYFSDTEISNSNQLAAGSFDLLINGQTDPQQIVSFSDLKPGDHYIATKSAEIVDNPGYLWLQLTDLVSSQGSQTEPEDLEESLNGIKHDIENYLTYDLQIANTTIIDANDQIPLPDVVSCWIPLGEIPGSQITTILQSFHFDDTVTNWAQGDDLQFTEEWFAIQSRHTDPLDQAPVSESGRVWDPQTTRCIDGVTPTPTSTPAPSITPDPGEPYIDQVTSLTGTFGNPVTLNSSVAIAQTKVTGAPDDQFIQISDYTQIIMAFTDNIAIDGPGDDIQVYIYDTLFPGTAEILISDDGITYTSTGFYIDTADALIDLADYGLSTVSHIKIIDSFDPKDTYPTLGYDLDAIQALNSQSIP